MLIPLFLCYIFTNFNYYCVASVQFSEDNIAGEIETLKNTVKVLSDQWEKWNTLFVTSLEPRITSTASTLSSIDSNIHNLQERAHVWDTFQLHITAWNEQLATMDRKIDILNKATELLTAVDNKINTMLAEDYKLDKIIKMINSLSETALSIENGMRSKMSCKASRDSLFEEFAIRGILSSLKLIERKLDQLLNTRKLDHSRVKDAAPTVKYVVSNSAENLLNDIASKIDTIMDFVSKANENDYPEEYTDVKDLEGSGYVTTPTNTQKLSRHKQQLNILFKLVDQEIKDVKDKVYNIDNSVVRILQYSKESDANRLDTNNLMNAMEQLLRTSSENQIMRMSFIMNNYFRENRVQHSSLISSFNKHCVPTSTVPTPKGTTEYAEKPSTPIPDFNSFTENIYTTNDRQYETRTETFFGDVTVVPKTDITSSALAIINIPGSLDIYDDFDTVPPTTTDKSSCGDLENDSPSGIYVFKSGQSDFIKERFFNKQFCEMRDNGLWIVIQRRDNYTIQQDFNVSWHDYKLGFGDLQRDFWMGNNYLSRLSANNNLTLRIELQDFDGNFVWAEYKEFKVAREEEQFRLTIGGYSGNASDSLTSHNGSPFSTYDRKNDYAPECCPCSVSYGGGWWFNRCFESNLNGNYYKNPFENGYFKGIIWEHWLGNYSLKKSLMMVKSRGSIQSYSNPNVTKVEDP